jgi:hypothetical protein
MIKWLFIITMTPIFASTTLAQSLKLTGKVSNATGESLPSAQLILLPDSITGITDPEGNFSITSHQPGQKELIVSFIGFETQRVPVELTRHVTVKINLKEGSNHLQEIVIEDKKDNQLTIYESNQTSTNVLDKKDINAIPVLGGEADVIKTLQLLPGTVRGVEGSSDLFVRGGAADQNLVLLDGAPVYNTSHLFGFLSVFNPDVLDNVEAINGGFPARYGGRLSSILSVNTTSDIPDKTHLSGDIGLIASRLFIEQPLIKNRASFWISGRRTYIDRVVKTIGEELPYHFYDLNGKFIFTPREKDHVEISYYRGNDLLDIFRDRKDDGSGFLTSYNSGNDTQALKWNHRFSNTLSSDLSITRSRYNYDMRILFEENRLRASSDVEDYGVRWMLTNDSTQQGGIFKTGVEWTRHSISPSVINTSGIITEFLKSSETRAHTANEFAIHSEYSWPLVEKLNLTAGFRGSMAIVNNKQYYNPEPRIAARYQLPHNQALKLSYSRMVQYIHRISNSAISSPTDLWYPVTKNIKPQTSHQIAASWQYTIPEKRVFLSVESYYKTMNKLIGYEEGTNLFLNTDFESKLIQGKGRAYGLEVLLRKDEGKFTGWISYTLSWSWRKFDEISQGHWFPSRYDRRHNGAIVAQYAFNKRVSFSAVWEFISGSRFTPVIGQYLTVAPTLTGVDVIPVYSGINQVKLANTHRLDVGLKFNSNPYRKFQWHWFVGVYNAYNRATPIGISIVQDETNGSLKYQQPGLFGFLPFISYGFKL